MQDGVSLIGFQNVGVGALAGAVVGVGMYAWLASSGRVLKKGEWVEFIVTTVVNVVTMPFYGSVVPTGLDEETPGVEANAVPQDSPVERIGVREVSFELEGYRVWLDTNKSQSEAGGITAVVYDENVSQPYLLASWIPAVEENEGYWRVEKLVMPKQVVFSSRTRDF